MQFQLSFFLYTKNSSIQPPFMEIDLIQREIENFKFKLLFQRNRKLYYILGFGCVSMAFLVPPNVHLYLDMYTITLQKQ